VNNCLFSTWMCIGNCLWYLLKWEYLGSIVLSCILYSLLEILIMVELNMIVMRAVKLMMYLGVICELLFYTNYGPVNSLLWIAIFLCKICPKYYIWLISLFGYCMMAHTNIFTFYKMLMLFSVILQHNFQSISIIICY
jgi:hypothetical protein